MNIPGQSAGNNSEVTVKTAIDDIREKGTISVESDTDTSTPSNGNKNITQKMSNRQRKQLKKAQKAFQKNMQDYMEFNRRAGAKQTKKFKILKGYVGKDIYNNLKKACTVTVPEQKNEAGEITQAAQTVVDQNKFLKELHFAIIVLREDRIERGLRKRTTGRHSDRAFHVSAVAEIKRRTAEIIARGEPVNEVKADEQAAPTPQE